MIINIKNIRQPLALGLRWLTATHSEVDYLKDKDSLGYGFVNKTHANKKGHYRCAVLTGDDNDKAISLAGLLADKYENLVFIHKIQPDLYWVCIVKQHEIWNELDLRDSTAGDYLCTKDDAEEIVQIAQDMFTESEISFKEIVYVSTQAEHDFSQYKSIKLSDLLSNTKKFYSKYKISLLKSHKKKIKAIVTYLIILILMVIAGIYLYSSQNASARERNRLQQQLLEKQRAERDRINYTVSLLNNILQNQGSRAITHVMNMVGKLSMQSAGWNIKEIKYASFNPEVLSVSLARGQYGDILTFKNSYAKNTINENISSDNNSGTKTLKFTDNQWSLTVTEADRKNIENIISDNSQTVRYKVIAIGQRMNLNFDTGPEQADRFNFSHSSFGLNGKDTWNLRKIQYILQKFPTVTITSVDMSVGEHNSIAWSIKGEIYG